MREARRSERNKTNISRVRRRACSLHLRVNSSGLAQALHQLAACRNLRHLRPRNAPVVFTLDDARRSRLHLNRCFAFRKAASKRERTEARRRKEELGKSTERCRDTRGRAGHMQGHNERLDTEHVRENDVQGTRRGIECPTKRGGHAATKAKPSVMKKQAETRELRVARGGRPR
eukprot:6176400-Pleurochrysis_carterae.AAC.1